MYKVVNTEEGYYCGGINNWLLEIGVVNSDFVSYNQKFFRKQYERSTDEDDDFLKGVDFYRVENGGIYLQFRHYCGCDFGESFKKLDTWSAYMITSYEDTEKYFGKKADKNRKIYNKNKWEIYRRSLYPKRNRIL